MNVTIIPSALKGVVIPPPSKSRVHRLIIAAALAEGESRILGADFSQDIAVTLSCVEKLGAAWRREGEVLVVTGAAPGAGKARQPGDLPEFDCGESGSTLRFMIPVALAAAGGGVFTGRGRLMDRPQGPYFDIFREKGVAYSLENGVLTVKGTLEPGTYRLPGNVSSQFFTGLLFALSLLDGESRVESEGALESGDYIEMTLAALKEAGVRAEKRGQAAFWVAGRAQYRPFEATAEADWSQAAFWLAAKAAGSDIDVQGMNDASLQGDKAVLSILPQLAGGADADIDMSACPDLAPPVAAAAALREKGAVTRLTGAARLRIKESDRLSTLAEVLSALGAEVEEGPDSLTVVGAGRLKGGCIVDSHNDHRIAMTAAVAAAGCENPVTILGADCVKKSYPDFWAAYESLGGCLTNLPLGVSTGQRPVTDEGRGS